MAIFARVMGPHITPIMFTKTAIDARMIMTITQVSGIQDAPPPATQPPTPSRYLNMNMEFLRNVFMTVDRDMSCR